jgi:hypothetical protein
MQLEKRMAFVKTKWVSLLDIPCLSLGYSWGNKIVSKIGHDTTLAFIVRRVYDTYVNDTEP